MKTISMLELCKNSEQIVQQIREGEQMVLTYRGKAVARLVPIRDESVREDDPFYRIGDLADSKGRSLSNTRTDKII